MSTRIYTRVLLVLLAVPLMSCDWLLNYKDDPNHCPGRPHNNCLNDAIGACQSDPDCGGETPVCDVTGTMMCVQCTADKDDACGGSTPVCVNNACQACTSHSQCSDSNVCLPDGACAAPDQVAYVEAGAAGASPCTKEAPCGSLQDGIDSDRPYVKIADGVLADTETTTINGKTVKIFAEPNAKLDRTGDGVILEVRGNDADVEIYGLEITGASGGAGDVGILLTGGGMPKLALLRAKVTNNIGGGISSSGGTLTVSQSAISGNQGGGISIMNGTFIIVGNVFYLNGSGGGLVGAISISAPGGSLNRLEFNSFNQNSTANAAASAIQCTTAEAFTARNNIMSGNGTLTNMEQVGGMCRHEYSIVRPGSLPSGAGNSNADPLFVDTTTGDLHLQPGSPALGAAAPNSDLSGLAARDVDGDLRMAPADIGADEVP